MRLAYWALAVTVAALSPPANSQQSSDEQEALNACADTSNRYSQDAQIAGCTKLIGSAEAKGAGASVLSVLHSSRGAAYGAKKDYDHAIEDFNEAIRLDRHNANAFFGLGMAYDAKGDLDAARDYYTKATFENADFAEAYRGRGEIYAKENDHVGAITDLKVAVRLQPNDTEALSELCFQQAIAGDWHEAVDECSRSLRLRPHDVMTLNRRGLAYLQLKKADEAIADFDAVLRMEPKTYSALYGRGLAQRLKGNATAAAADISAAKRMSGQVVSVFASFGLPATWPAPPPRVKLSVFHLTVENKSSHTIKGVGVGVTDPETAGRIEPAQRHARTSDFDIVENGHTRHTDEIAPGARAVADFYGFSLGTGVCVYRVSFGTDDHGSADVKENLCGGDPSVTITDDKLYFTPVPVAAAAAPPPRAATPPPMAATPAPAASSSSADQCGEDADWDNPDWDDCLAEMPGRWMLNGSPVRFFYSKKFSKDPDGEVEAILGYIYPSEQVVNGVHFWRKRELVTFKCGHNTMDFLSFYFYDRDGKYLGPAEQRYWAAPSGDSDLAVWHYYCG